MAGARDRSPSQLIPAGRWIEVEPRPGLRVVGFTYLDPTTGFSARGWEWKGSGLDPTAGAIVRLSVPGRPWRLLAPDEIERLGLETTPDWLESCGPQPEPGSLWGEWRNHPLLREKLHPEHPDDLQVVVHDGGPRLTSHAPEAVWVSITGAEGDLFRGRVLNQPFHLQSVSAHDEIRFAVPPPGQPVMLTERYLAERAEWRVHPCGKCGFTELFDAPSDLIRATFPELPEGGVVEAFTTTCPLCGGTQGLERRGAAGPTSPPPPKKRPWWRRH
jgi:ribosomal protein S27AE